MQRRTQIVPATLACLLLTWTPLEAHEPEKPSGTTIEITLATEREQPTDEAAPLVQVALLLDTSNSMDGLIRQAQAQLWAIVNELAEKKRNGQKPRLEVALFEYGNNRLPATENYVRQVVPLVDDLDRISEALFELTTDGGSEYCGAVIAEATSVLDWKPGDDHYKAIFIAGNEPFTQGEIDHVTACLSAKTEGIVVNTIFCGAEAAGIDGKWNQGAAIGGGKYLTINQDRAVVHVECPQDAELLKLNIELNSTYLPFGQDGAKGHRRQRNQDESAAELSAGAAASRVVSKSKANAYRNSSWDLVDAMAADSSVLDAAEVESLPALLRGKSTEEQKQLVEEAAKKRKEIQTQIAKLAKDRAEFLKKQQAESANEGSLGRAVQDLIREQTNAKGFE